MTPASLRKRVLDQIATWQPDRGPPRELVAERPEMAVAEGAAHYGMVRRGLGTRIGGHPLFPSHYRWGFGRSYCPWYLDAKDAD